MVKAIQLHIEGGRNKSQDIEFRKAFRTFFSKIDALCQDCGVRFLIVLHGSRNSTYDQFKSAVKRDPQTYHVLLVDSEDPVEQFGRCWEHLKARNADNWDRPAEIEDEQCQLMAHAMEAWFFADPQALLLYYGQGFRLNSISKRQDVEEIPKVEHLRQLEAASKDTTKGRYHKLEHGPQILSRLNSDLVRQRAKHCDRIFVTLIAKVNRAQ